jgi:TolB protein
MQCPYCKNDHDIDTDTCPKSGGILNCSRCNKTIVEIVEFCPNCGEFILPQAIRKIDEKFNYQDDPIHAEKNEKKNVEINKPVEEIIEQKEIREVEKPVSKSEDLKQAEALELTRITDLNGDNTVPVATASKNDDAKSSNTLIWVGLAGGIALLCTMIFCIVGLISFSLPWNDWLQNPLSPTVLYPTQIDTPRPFRTSTSVSVRTPPTPSATFMPTSTPTLTQTPTPSLTSTPKLSVPKGKIVYTCQIDKDERHNQLCIVNADGTDDRQLTYDDRTNNWYASVAPDGNSIVFSSNQTGSHEIYEMDLQRNQRLLTNLGGLYAPEISPDGRYIVFTNGSDTYSEIWVMNRDGSNPNKAYAEYGKDALDPTWSPDGQRILFALGTGENKKLYIINRNGSGLQLVSTGFFTRGRSDWSSNDLIAGYSGPSWNRDIFTLSIDEPDPVLVTDGGNNLAPSFSPDGQWITFTSYQDDFGNDEGCEIYIMRIDGTDVRQLTNTSYCNFQPRWGP